MRTDRETDKLTQMQMYKKLFIVANNHCLRKGDSKDKANRAANTFASGATADMWRKQYEK